jgi:tRNA U34 2-thiouridine synthase MnmA/TrmU
LPDKRVKVEFDQPQPAITPGQVLGIYNLDDEIILGGAWID